MNCFIFRDKPGFFPRICGVTPLHDMALHLRNSGIGEIFTDSESDSPLVKKISYTDAKPALGNTWLAAYEGMITRQPPGELMEHGTRYGADYSLSLSCSGTPWKHTTVLTGKKGIVQSFETGSPPENTRTNLCFSGLVLVGSAGFDPVHPMAGASAFLLPGYWSVPSDRENYLRTSHDVLSGRVPCWPGKTGIVTLSRLPESSRAFGTLWADEGCRIGENCVFENCVILNGADIGNGSNLKNCLVGPGVSVKPGTIRDDKYLTLLGDD